NGLAFSPDERMLYVNDSRRGHIRAFDVDPTGLLALASDHVFATLQGDRIGVPDGMKVDVEGNVYCTGPGGIWIFDPQGTHLGTIATGAHTTNVARCAPDTGPAGIWTYRLRIVAPSGLPRRLSSPPDWPLPRRRSSRPQ